MMTRPKTNTDEKRVIVDLSWPRGHSGIKRGHYQGNQCTYSLPGIMDTADEVARICPAAYLWSADLVRAYKQAYIDCMDTTARLGLVLSPGKCTPSTKAIEWLGFNIDANAMQVTIPEEELHDTLEECQTWTN